MVALAFLAFAGNVPINAAYLRLSGPTLGRSVGIID